MDKLNVKPDHQSIPVKNMIVSNKMIWLKKSFSKWS